ncbi:glycosyltransferase family 2 protein [Sulfurimonas sp.]|uniref:glycosyltransferase family 2 protein n=1 Tax=Sulfurimonas sp. TaxID=2022749 RepID=UPI003563CD27
MNKNNPLVSIIMSSYNHERFVEKAILSAINQTYKDIELIVIDDGSKDRSPEILKNLQEKYGFHLELRANHGLVKTLNYALKNLTNGKFVCILDSDDYFHESKIEKQVAVLEQNPDCGLCYNPIYYVDVNDTIISDKIDKKNTLTGYIFEEFFRGDAHIPDGGVLIPLKVFQDIGYYDEDVELEDYQLWFKILSKYPVCYIDELLTYYRTHETNVSNDEYKMLLWERQVINKWKDHPVYEKSKPFVFNRWFAKFAKYNKKEALIYLFKIIKYKTTYADKNFYKGIRRLLFYWKT